MLNIRCRASREPAWDCPADMPQALWRLLDARGVNSPEDASRFLAPSVSHLIDPMALHDMGRAAGRILRARDAGETVCVWGDYDVDGVSAAAILSGVLEGMGVDVFCYIPSRHNEGYGLNEAGIDDVAQRAGLLVTVDCGVSAVELVAYAQAKGLDVVVTDHHRPGDDLPPCLVVNPLLGDYPNGALCGAGVAFKLALALDEALAMPYIDLAALATVADVVPLTGENRAIVALGLLAMNGQPRPGIGALMEAASIERGSLSAGKIAFQLAPRLNAGGRVGSAVRSLHLLQAKTYEEAGPMAVELDHENTARRALEQVILKDAARQLGCCDLAAARVIVLHGDGWNSGVIGLAASRLVEQYTLPTVLLAGEGETLTGSCRSIPGVDIFECLKAVSEYLVRFGGHKQAAGLTIERKNLLAFGRELARVIEDSTDPDAFIPYAEYDLKLELEDLSLELARLLDKLQPTGFGNPAPVFLSMAEVDEARAIGRDGAHLSLMAVGGDARLRGVWFGAGARAASLPGPARPILYVPRVNAFMNRVSLELEVKGMGMGALTDALKTDEAGEARLLHAFLTQRFYNKIPARADAPAVGLKQVSDWLLESPRGTLIVASDVSSAREALGDFEARGLDGRLDVYEGEFPGDRRAFNALAVLPLGEVPQGYRRVVALGAPAYWLAPGLTKGVYELDSPPAGYLAQLPDVDELRQVYIAVRELLRRPYAARSPEVVSRELADGAGVSAIAAHAALYALHDMRLIEVSWERPLALSEARKADPAGSEVFSLISALRTWGGARA